MNALMAAVFVTLSFTAVAQPVATGAAGPAFRPDPSKYVEGTDYLWLGKGPAGSTTVEVVEIFQYRCIHCWNLEPHLEAWNATSKPAYVTLVRIPAPWGSRSTLHAKAFYTAEALGKLPEMHSAFFTEIHERGNHLDTREALAEFFLEFAVSNDDFTATFDSLEVEKKVQGANELALRYAAMTTGTPAIVVNGNWSVRAKTSYQAWFELIDLLAEEERNRYLAQ